MIANDSLIDHKCQFNCVPLINRASRDWLNTSSNQSHLYRLSWKTFLRNLKFDHAPMCGGWMYRTCMRDVIAVNMIVTVHIYGTHSRTEESSSYPNKWMDLTLTVPVIARPNHQYFIPVRLRRRFFWALVENRLITPRAAEKKMLSNLRAGAVLYFRMTTRKTDALARETISLSLFFYTVRNSLTAVFKRDFDGNRISEFNLMNLTAIKNRAPSNLRVNRLIKKNHNRRG